MTVGSYGSFRHIRQCQINAFTGGVTPANGASALASALGDGSACVVSPVCSDLFCSISSGKNLASKCNKRMFSSPLTLCRDAVERRVLVECELLVLEYSLAGLLGIFVEVLEVGPTARVVVSSASLTRLLVRECVLDGRDDGRGLLAKMSPGDGDRIDR